ncbi:MAG: glycosyltransferase [Rhodocyclaceae bacterium]
MSAEITLKAFLLGHLRRWQSRGDLTVFANGAAPDLLARNDVRAELRHVGIERPIRPWADLRALFSLWWALRRGRFDLVFSVTPKAGLVAMLAAWLARVPARVHIFTGQVWATRAGRARWLLKQLDKLMAALATHVLVDGEPQRQFLLAEGVLQPGKGRVLADGSLCGVDLQRFVPDASTRAAVRAEQGAPDDATVFLYLGRLNRDKGVLDLAQAFAQSCRTHPGSQLWVVGPDEAGLTPQLRELLASCESRVRLLPFAPQPERLMAAADVFVLPSYREGFPTSVLEAAACGLPTVAARVYGTQGALVEDEGGLMFTAGDVAELEDCLNRLVADASLRSRLGVSARQRAAQSYAADRVLGAFAEFIESAARRRA